MNRLVCLRRDTFCQQRQKVSKDRRQNQGFEILSAAEVPTVSISFLHANRSSQNSYLSFASSLRLIPRRAPRLCCPGLTGKIFVSTVRRDVGIAPYTRNVVFPQGTMPTSSRLRHAPDLSVGAASSTPHPTKCSHFSSKKGRGIIPRPFFYSIQSLNERPAASHPMPIATMIAPKSSADAMAKANSSVAPILPALWPMHLHPHRPTMARTTAPRQQPAATRYGQLSTNQIGRASCRERV